MRSYLQEREVVYSFTFTNFFRNLLRDKKGIIKLPPRSFMNKFHLFKEGSKISKEDLFSKTKKNEFFDYKEFFLKQDQGEISKLLYLIILAKDFENEKSIVFFFQDEEEKNEKKKKLYYFHLIKDKNGDKIVLEKGLLFSKKPKKFFEKGTLIIFRKRLGAQSH